MNNSKRTNKKRNSSLLFEFLVKHISKCLIEDKKEEANKALEISKKYFAEGTPLRSELKLFQAVMDSKKLSRESVNKMVDYACKSASLMNSRILDEEKSKLIKEINYNLDKKIYDHRVSEYTNLSTLQTLFNESRSKNKRINEFEKIKLQDSLVTRLVEGNNNKVQEKKLNPEMNSAVYKILVNKFHEKYASKITEGQKKFLVEYATCLMSEDKNKFSDLVNKESNRIVDSLTNVKDQSIKNDKNLAKNLQECLYKFGDLKVQVPEDKDLVEFMNFIGLADELLTEEDKNE